MQLQLLQGQVSQAVVIPKLAIIADICHPQNIFDDRRFEKIKLNNGL